MASKYIPDSKPSPKPAAGQTSVSLPEVPPKIYLKTLFIDRGSHPQYDNSLMLLARAACQGFFDIDMGQIGLGDGGWRQLNRSVTDFLKTDNEIFLLIGSDVDFEPLYIAHMAEACRRTGGIIGGLIAIKEKGVRWMYNAIPQDEGQTEPRHGIDTMDEKTRLREIARTGLECLMIPRAYFLAFQKAHPELRYISQLDAVDGVEHEEWMYFHSPIMADEAGVPRMQSEDYALCQYAREMGFKVYLDASHYCGHWDFRTRYPFGWPMGKLPEEKTKE